MSKGLALVALMMLFPFTARADHYSSSYYKLSLAEELGHVLQNIAYEASDQADDAAHYHQYAEAKALSDLADSAASVENKLYNSVIVPLQYGESDNVVAAHLQRLESSFSLLASDGRAASRYSYYLSKDVREALSLKSELLDLLSAGDRGRSDRPTRPVRPTR